MVRTPLARDPAITALAAPDPWRSPVAGLTVVHPFDGPERPWLPGHRGVDLDAPPGTPVLAPRSGVVTFAGVVVDRPVLTVQHEDGLRSSVEPVTATVAVGDQVTAGATLGTVTPTRTHCDPASCLHWGVRDGEAYLDPLLLLHGGPVVLLSRTSRLRSGVPLPPESDRDQTVRHGAVDQRQHHGLLARRAHDSPPLNPGRPP